mmetsp:Transcript_5495/g.12948  ORF Transcript_5495/g.12948 Transcript_5495/m.12948 type:complete len:238 (-) Transcript_5495:811-1524(-)
MLPVLLTLSFKEFTKSLVGSPSAKTPIAISTRISSFKGDGDCSTPFSPPSLTRSKSTLATGKPPRSAAPSRIISSSDDSSELGEPGARSISTRFINLRSGELYESLGSDSTDDSDESGPSAGGDRDLDREAGPWAKPVPYLSLSDVVECPFSPCIIPGELLLVSSARNWLSPESWIESPFPDVDSKSLISSKKLGTVRDSGFLSSNKFLLVRLASRCAFCSFSYTSGGTSDALLCGC